MTATSEDLLQTTAHNRSFSRTIPGSQTAIDSTSLGTFKVCPRMYYYSVIQGWTPREQSVHLTFGLLVHQGLERYDHAVAKGSDHSEALRTTVRWVLEATWNKPLARPWISNDPNKNRVTLIRSLIWYLDQFGPNDSLQTITLTNGKPAVELSFSFDIGWTTPSGGEAVIACGHLDRLAMFAGEPVIADRKTTKGALSPSWFNKFSPGNQFSMYTLAGRLAFDLPVRKLVVDGMQVLVGGTRFQRGLVIRTDGQVEEWLSEAHWWLGQMDDCVVRQQWPMNDRSCDQYGGCAFREVCARPAGAREQWLAATFTRRTWDPLERRGDI